MIAPDLKKLVDRELIAQLPNVPIRVVRSNGSRWGYQEVEIAIGDARIQRFFEKGYYEAKFSAATDTRWFSWSEVLPHLPESAEPLVSRDARETVAALRRLLSQNWASLAQLFAEPRCQIARDAMLVQRKARFR